MGVYLSQPATEKSIHEGMGNGMSFCAAEMQGKIIHLLSQGWRKNMQDAAIHNLDIGDGNSLFAVFDGHGGHQVSKYVEQIFIKELVSLSQYKNKDYVAALDLAFKLTDEKIISPQGAKALQSMQQTQQLNPDISSGTGCTANVCLITPTHFFVANAGDSRSVLCRSGKALELSFDHKPQSPQQQNRIRNAGGHIQMGRVNGGLNLTRSFGDFIYKRNTNLPYNLQMITCKPDIKTVPRDKQNDEYIILGCDGIWERFVDNSQGMIDLLNSELKGKKENKKIMEDLLDNLLASETSQGIGCDNMTGILVRFVNTK